MSAPTHIPTKMKAAVTTGRTTSASGDKLEIVEVREVDVPKPGPKEILVKVYASAANPTDWKTPTMWYPKEGNVLGSDYAGTIVAYGSDVYPEHLRQVGARVAGFVLGGSSPNGAHAEYVAAPAIGAILIPDSWSFEQACQVAACAFTACQMLFYALPLPMPTPQELSSSSPSNPTPAATTDPNPTKANKDVDADNIDTILIWGGSSSLGQASIQLAHLTHPFLKIISTSSPHNFPLLLSLGATHVFSHRESDTPQKIKDLVRAESQKGLKYALDTISEGKTIQQVAECIGEEGGAVSTALPYDSPRGDVEARFVLAGMLLGIDLQVPFVRQADPAQHAFAKRANELLTYLATKELYKPGKVRVMPNGLESVNDGLELLKSGKVSGEKIVFRISDTPGLSSSN